MDKDAQIAALETALKCERVANQRLRDDRRWQAFCAALGGLNANPVIDEGHAWDAQHAKMAADAALEVMCAEEPERVSPAVEAWRALTQEQRESVGWAMERDARVDDVTFGAAIAVLREAEMAGE